MVSKRAAVVAMALLGGLTLSASVAWSCTSVVSPTVDIDPNRGPAGTVVTVTGGNWYTGDDFVPSHHPLDVMWTGEQAQRLARIYTNGDGTFSVRVTIPSAPVGVYYLKVTQDDKTVNAPFEIAVQKSAGTGTEESPSTPESTSGRASGGSSRSPSGDMSNAIPEADTQSDSPAAVGSRGGDQIGSPGSSGGIPVPQPKTGVTPAPAAGGVGPGSEVAPTPAIRRSSPAALLATGADSRDGQGTPAVGEADASGSRRSVSQAWAGFEPGKAVPGTGLSDLAGRRPAPDYGVQASIALLAGLTAVLSGFALAELRRRRELADSFTER